MMSFKQFCYSLVFFLTFLAERSRADLIDDEKKGPTTPTSSSPKPADPLTEDPFKADEPPKPSETPHTKKSSKPKPSTPPSAVKFTSKGLRASKKEGTLFLEEDVVVTQDDMRMESDEAKVLFEDKTNTVKEIHATCYKKKTKNDDCRVKFFRTDPETQQKIRAESREATFYNLEQKVVLKGDPKLWRGDDKMVGRVISYDLKTGWIKADKVEGLVQPATVKQQQQQQKKAK